MDDIRTPSVYFENKDKVKSALVNLEAKLDDLLNKIQTMKVKRSATSAAKEIASNEYNNLKTEQYRQKS